MVMTPRSLQNYIMPYAMTALLDEKMLKVTQTCIQNFEIKIPVVCVCVSDPSRPPTHCSMRA